MRWSASGISYMCVTDHLELAQSGAQRGSTYLGCRQYARSSCGPPSWVPIYVSRPVLPRHNSPSSTNWVGDRLTASASAARSAGREHVPT